MKYYFKLAINMEPLSAEANGRNGRTRGIFYSGASLNNATTSSGANCV
jgi:hypothetical protein